MARSTNNDGHLSRLQLWKGEKRTDQAVLWGAVEARPGAGELVAPQSVGDQEAEAHNRPRVTPDFLPVDPTASLDHHTPTNGEHSGSEGNGVSMESTEQWVTRKTREFNQLTRERPNSEELWLRFADFQAQAVTAVDGDGELC